MPETDLLDAKLRVIAADIDLADGRLIVKAADSSYLDGKVVLVFPTKNVAATLTAVDYTAALRIY